MTTESTLYTGTHLFIGEERPDQALGHLPAGSSVNVLSLRQNWVEVEAGDNIHGFVALDDVSGIG